MEEKEEERWETAKNGKEVSLLIILLYYLSMTSW